MRRVRHVLVLSLVAAVPARGQLRGTFDVGASAVDEAGVPSAAGLSAAATVDAIASRGWLRASALGVTGSGLESSGQGLVAGSFDLRTAGLVRPFLGGSGSFFTQSTLDHSATVELSAGARLAAAGHGASLTTLAGVSTGHGSAQSVYRALGDAWITANTEQLSFELAFTSSHARFVDGVPASMGSGPQTYVDAMVGWRHEGKGLSLGLSGGVRNGTSVAAGGAWGIGDIGVWLAPRVALALTGGNALEDVVHGIPRTTYVTAGIHIATQPHSTVFGQSAATGPRMMARVVGEGRRIEVLGVIALRVEIMGDFTEWQPVDLERAGTVWRLERPIMPGPHRVVLRIDGGEWTVPANLPHVDDDVGGPVGVITIP